MSLYAAVTGGWRVQACASTSFAVVGMTGTHGMGASARISDQLNPKQRTPGTQEVPL